MRSEALLYRLERAFGSLLVALGTLQLLAWWFGRAGDRHGMIYVFIGGVVTLPLGIALILAAVALTLRTPWRWLRQIFPLLWILALRSGLVLPF